MTPIPDGYMVGRLISREAAVGPWWEYIKAETDFDKAVRFATQLADRAAARAWIYESPQHYYEITRRPPNSGS